MKAWAPEEEKKEKSSKWDDDEGPRASAWSRTWRERVRAVLPSGQDGAALPTDPEVRRLAAALWRDVVEWARREGDAERHLQLFTGEPLARVSSDGMDARLKSEEWAFVPTVDLLLVVCEGAVGATAEGIFADSRPGHERMSFEDVLAGKHTERKEKERREKDRDKDRDRDRDRSEKRDRGDRDDERRKAQ